MLLKIFGCTGICCVIVLAAQANDHHRLQRLLTPLNGAFKASVKANDDSGSWRKQLQVTGVPGQPEALDIIATFQADSEKAAGAAFVSFTFSAWNRENYVMVPAAIYNGNRYRSIGNGYNPPYPEDMYYNPAVPWTISNNPRLADSPHTASLIELQTGNASLPAMCFYAARQRKGFIVLTDQQTVFGNSGLTITENAAQDSCTFTISAPAVRQTAPGFGDFHQSADTIPLWGKGQLISIHCRVLVFSANGIPDLSQTFMQVRKTLTGENKPRNLLPFSKVLELGTAICSGNWTEVPAGAYFKPENNNDFQLGWVSGMINTYPMLAIDVERERKRVAAEIDFVISKLQGKSGYCYGGITDKGQLIAEKMHAGFTPVQAMVRKNGDALLWLLKHLMLLKAQGHADLIKASWENAAQNLAQAFVNTWKKNGQFGQYIVPETGRIAVFNSTAGAVAPAGLAAAAAYFNNKEFLQTAEEAAAYYFERDVVKQGLTGGNCGDISQDADSESAFGLLESLWALYASTGNPAWLQKAEVQAALCATWVLAYDEVFPPASTIAKLNSHMAGAVFASIQNKHAAPGICTASGDYLFKLYRATGNSLYADLIRDIQHAHAEAVDMPGHSTTNYGWGTSMERIQPSDAEGKNSIGNYINTRNSWTETSGMLMALELPGIYLRTDTPQLYVFDHVNASIIKQDAKGTALSVTNNTPYDATVSVFKETKASAGVPLGFTAFLNWRKIVVSAGKTQVYHIPSEEWVAADSAEM